MEERKDLATLLEEALRQPMLRKWNLKRKKAYAVHKDFNNWEYGRREKLESVSYIFQHAALASKVDGSGWRACQKAVYVIAKRMAPRNWMEQNVYVYGLWDSVDLLRLDDEEFNKGLELFEKRLRYEYTKEEYPYGR